MHILTILFAGEQGGLEMCYKLQYTTAGADKSCDFWVYTNLMSHPEIFEFQDVIKIKK